MPNNTVTIECIGGYPKFQNGEHVCFAGISGVYKAYNYSKNPTDTPTMIIFSTIDGYWKNPLFKLIGMFI